MSDRLLLVPLDDAVVFPGMSLTLAVDVGEEERVLLVPRHGQEFASVGTVAEVADRVRLPGGARAVALQGLHRGVAGAAHTLPDGRLFVEVEEHPDDVPVDGRTRNLEREYRAVVEEILELRGDDGRISAFVRSITEPGSLADTAGYSPEIGFEQKVELLQTVDVSERLELALKHQRERLAELQVRKRIREDVESGAEAQQREYFLRKQMESIRKELGEDDASVVEEYRTKIEEAGMPEHAREQAEKELGPAREDGRAERRVERDPDLPGLADRGAVEQAAPTSGSIPRTQERSWTPITRAWTTSRSGSSSTSRSRSSARTAASPRTSAPARS